MRSALQLFIGAAVTIAAAGCSLLVSFDDPPPIGSGSSSGFDESSSSNGSVSSSSSSSSSGHVGTSSSSSSSTSSSSSSSSSSSGSTLPAGCVAQGVNLNALDCATPGYNQPNCAREPGLDPNQTLDQANALVDCNAAKQPICVTTCANGCIPLPSPLSDQCDGCAAKADGNYCGSDVGFLAPDKDVAITCTGGKYVALSRFACAAGTCNKANCQGLATSDCCN